IFTGRLLSLISSATELHVVALNCGYCCWSVHFPAIRFPCFIFFSGIFFPFYHTSICSGRGRLWSSPGWNRGRLLQRLHFLYFPYGLWSLNRSPVTSSLISTISMWSSCITNCPR